MLKLEDVTKVYKIGDLETHALKGINLEFRKSEFVSILGPSGCGKTTLLNIIGGLDKYTTGDLIINGKSTKEYKDKDWDSYRNFSIGFVFQSYNLIPHQTVLENVELALTLSGVSKKERKEKAIAVLEKVGLKDKIHNRPNQLSGGQMQRVAIARALVNNPDIILADEPTGALDSVSSVQIMEILKEISKDKLIVMVTHNPELANKYSSRIVNLLDGNLISDSNPFTKEDLKEENKEMRREAKKVKEKKKRMSFFTAMFLSFKNLLTKKTRTILVSFAGSIGIIGIALILSISSGFNTYVNKMQEDTLSTYPITIEAKNVDFSAMMMAMFLDTSESKDAGHDLDGVYDKDSISSVIDGVGSNLNSNDLKKFKTYIEDNYDEIKDYVNAIQYTYDMDLEFYLDNNLDGYSDINSVQPNNNSIMQMIIKYSLYFFENKTNVKVESILDSNNKPTGSYRISKIEGVTPDYTFVDQYENLSFIKTALEYQGYVDLDNNTVLYLAFTLMGYDVSSMSSSSSSSSSLTSSMTIFYEMIDNKALIESQYDLLAGSFIETNNDALLVLDSNNEVDEYVLYALGLLSEDNLDTILKDLVLGRKTKIKIDYNDIIGTEYRVLEESDYYVMDEGNLVDFREYKNSTDPVKLAKYQSYYKEALNNCTNKIKIVGIVKTNESTENGSLSTGVAYSKGFNDAMINYHNSSSATQNDKLETIDSLTPASINIYVSSFDSKEVLTSFIDEYNAQAENGDEISYTDYVGLIMSTVSTIINAITYVLIAFVSVSLVVSSIMIGIITYISVIERTKEIGVLRSVGASKKDVKRVFNAESFIIGLASGISGIVITLLLNIPINILLKNLTQISNIAVLPLGGAITLVVISFVLTLIAGSIPARIAAKKDPVIALRTE